MQLRIKKTTIIKILQSLGLLIIVLVILDYPWISANLRYLLDRKPAATVTQNSQTLPKGEPNILEIPSLKIKAPVIYVNQTDEKTFQAALRNGVVHYPGTAQPGQSGNVYIFGHSSDYIWSDGHYKTVFATLPHIQKGAEIDLSDAAGNIYKYMVTGTAVVAPDQTGYLNQAEYKKKLLTVQTSYPVGTALKRFLVFAELQP